MKLLFTILLLLGAAVALSLLAQHDPGYVLINYSGWSVEGSFTIFMLVAVLLFIAFYLLLRLLFGTLHLPSRMVGWRHHRQADHARELTQQGLIALAEGNWQRAEKKLSRAAEHSDTPLINYLGAARAAQKQGEEQRRDDYLSEAYKSMPEAELAVGLTQADLQLSQGQAEQALATLHYLHTIAPKHAYVLYLLKKLYEKLESWDELFKLLPALKQHHVLTGEAFETFELRVHHERINASATLPRLEEVWAQVGKKQQHTPALLYDYAHALQQLGAEQQAEDTLHAYLRKNWDATLMRLYGRLRGEDANRQLLTAEQWLEHHEQHPELLLALGRISLYNQLWGKARSYLEASLGSEARAETCCELGNLLQQLGETERAGEYFRQGLVMSCGDHCSDISVPKHGHTLHPTQYAAAEQATESMVMPPDAELKG